MGNTGSGKSTLINCLVGAEMKIIDISNGARQKILAVDLKNKNTGKWAGIGHTSFSTTSIPHAYKSQE